MELIHADQVVPTDFDAYSLYNQVFVLDSDLDSYRGGKFKLAVVLACSFIVLVDDLLLVLIIMILYTTYHRISFSLVLASPIPHCLNFFPHLKYFVPAFPQ
jgi:hypothetical protein